MKNIALFLFGLLCFASACTDEELDPFQLDKITKGSIISLRGPAADNLNDLSFRGAVDKFSITGDPSTEKFEFDAAYLSDDPNSLQQVEVYARRTETGARVRLLTIPGSNFTVRSDIDAKYPSTLISIPLNDILSALGITLGDIAPNEYLYIESDLTLTDGTLVPSSAIVNGNLFQSSLFYPAHKLFYLAQP